MIKQKSNGKWTVDIRDTNGKRISRTFKKKSDASAFQNTLNNQKYENKLVKAKLLKPKISIQEAKDTYLKSKYGLAAKSICQYKSKLNNLKVYFESANIIYLNEFKPDMANEILSQLQSEIELSDGRKKRLNAKTINSYIDLYKDLFEHFITNGNIYTNPFGNIKRLKEKSGKPDFYTNNELERFFNQYMENWVRNAFKGYLLTGMRFSELASLKWRNVDLANRKIHIMPDSGSHLKTKQSQRVIDIPDELKSILESLNNKNTQDDDLVFTDKRNVALKERNLLRKAKEIGKKAKITSKITIHKFRHTFASKLVQCGVRLEVIQNLLGHSNISETLGYADVGDTKTDIEKDIIQKLFC